MPRPPKPPKTDAMKARQSRRIATFAIALALCAGAYVAYTMMQPVQVAAPQPQMQTSDKTIYPSQQAPREQTPTHLGELKITPPEINMGATIVRQQRASRSVTVTAVDAKATIKTVAMPFAQDIGMRIDASQCLSIMLDIGQSCPITVVFDPIRPGSNNNTISITADFTLSNGSVRGVTYTIPVDATAENPPPPVVQAPVAQAPAEQAAARDPYSLDDLAYLAKRRRPGLLDIQFDPTAFGHLGPQRPSQDNWRSIGYGPNISTMPVDMTRVVTMDKPIPAVLKLPIDSRQPSRAIATVERDIYGSDGSIAVIERGSVLIGTAQSVASTAEEKVGIAWERLMRPDGSAWSLTATSGDAQGRSGVLGFIDNRWMERFGTTLAASALVSGLDIALNASQSTTSNGTSTTTTTNSRYLAAQQFSGDFRAIFGQYAKEQMQIPPIRTIPAGTRITIFPTTDLWLRPINPTEEMRADNMRRVSQDPQYIAAAARAAAAAGKPDNAARTQQQANTLARAGGGLAPAPLSASQIPAPSDVGANPRPAMQDALGGLSPVVSPGAAPLDAPPAASGQAAFASGRSAVETFNAANPNIVHQPSYPPQPYGYGQGGYGAGGYPVSAPPTGGYAPVPQPWAR